MRDRSPLRVIPRSVQNYKREIAIPRPPALRDDTVARARDYGAHATQILVDFLDGVCRAYQTGHTGWFGVPAAHPHPENFTSFDRILWTGAFCVMLFECLCAAALAAMTLAVPTAAAVLIGVAFTAVFTLTMKAVWHLHIAPDESQPRRALATLYRWLMPLFVAWALALTVASLLPRLIDESTPFINLCFNVDMSVLTVLSSALSGLLFAAAHLYGWARVQTRLYHELLKLRRDVESLLQECDRIAVCSRSAQPEREDHRNPPDLARHAGQAAFGLLMAALIASPVAAQARGEFWFDDSGSASIQDLRAAEDQFFTVLPLAVDAGVQSWELFRFSRNAANARPVARFEVEPFVEPSCDSAVQANELTRLFRRPQMAAKRSDDKKCADLRATARRAFDNEVSSKVKKTREDFDAAPRAAGSCTALYDLMNRLKNQSSAPTPAFVIVVSDAIESCVSLRGARLAQPSFAMRAVMIVVPSSTREARAMSPWQEFELRKRVWNGAVPWMEVVQIPALTSRMFAVRQ